MKLRNVASVSLLTALLVTPALAGKGPGRSGGGTALSAAEAATLTFMREEEKLARDVYQAMADEWGLAVFVNIAASEQRHMDSIKTLLDRYGLPDPILGVGEFSDSSLQDLYDDLIDRGLTSELEALYVGALIEEVDIEDLQDAIAETDHPDLARVYGNLMRGSRNHLRAFVGYIEDLGLDYEAQHLSQEEVDEILDSPWERGPFATAGGGGRRGSCTGGGF